MTWKHPSSPVTKKFKVQQSATKVMTTEFWDSRRMILLDILPKGESVNADRYCETLDRLRHAVRRKRPGLLRSGVVLQHDNATPTRQNAQRNGLNVTDLAYRFDEAKVEPPLPSIPCQPVSYGAAKELLRQMSGENAPSDWSGGLDIVYKLGPGFTDPDMKVELNVTNKNQRAKAENVFGIIKGAIEPDRYVLMGNHRDAWIYGAIDPSSGTAVMLEMARVMGELVSKGTWRPRRSIIFCSWGAEEYGLIGSAEWVEQYVSTLRERAVAYLNIDIAIRGNDTLKASSTPLMHNIVYEASKKVRNPNPAEIAAGRLTVFDTWQNVLTPPGESLPIITSLGSGSDYAPLLQKAGITAIDASYSFDGRKYRVPSYPLYHTEYETFDIVKRQYDRDFQFHAAVGRVNAEMLRNLADSLILPFHIASYTKGLKHLKKTLDTSGYGAVLRANLDNYGKLDDVITEFGADVANFEKRLDQLDKNNPYQVREVNDQILLLEKAFLISEGLPTRPSKKHILFAENANDAYAASSFPGLVDLLFQIEQDPASADRWERVKRHFSAILHTIQSAGATLRDTTMFMSEQL
ncbi:N-acetylated-alpha-linked acidic dipeptidase 2 [Plakobranchus ocellatus]|uniref:N-acetylated-alpha-linked acidic dipeptidase 2 n=1 Tax=Plakobranchus ocellatus TaxID=259542 RepID=A0AAV4BQ48_9GAST|nr:N-acetylated-alpha-linked acidic dipeptidase 2 [Plakobranchus ocellatus]